MSKSTKKSLYGPLETENKVVGVRSADTPESIEDDHGATALKKRKRGGKVEGDKPKFRLDRRAKGGKVAAKGTKINIIVAPSAGAPSGAPPVGAGGPPMMPPPMMPPRPPMAAPPQGGPMPPPGMVGRKSGGRVGAYPIDDGAGGGKGRKEKIAAYGKNAKP